MGVHRDLIVALAEGLRGNDEANCIVIVVPGITSARKT